MRPDSLTAMGRVRGWPLRSTTDGRRFAFVGQQGRLQLVEKLHGLAAHCGHLVASLQAAFGGGPAGDDALHGERSRGGAQTGCRRFAWRICPGNWRAC